MVRVSITGMADPEDSPALAGLFEIDSGWLGELALFALAAAVSAGLGELALFALAAAVSAGVCAGNAGGLLAPTVEMVDVIVLVIVETVSVVTVLLPNVCVTGQVVVVV